MPALVTRRESVKTLSLASLLALGIWPGTLRAAGLTRPKSRFTFVVVNDTHYVDEACRAWLQQAVRQMRLESPAFCLHLGDLVESCSRGRLVAVRDVFSELGAPVYYQIGNHDYGRADDRSAYEEVFPHQLNYHFEHEGWLFIGLDSTDGQRWQHTSISDASLQFLDDVLRRVDRGQPLVLFTHFPFGEEVAFRPMNADAVLSRLLDHNVQAVFSGHYHGLTEKHHRGAILTTGRCCALQRTNHDGNTAKGFVVCTASESGLERRFVEVPPPS